MSSGKYAKNKKPDLTYVSKPVCEDKDVRYISKVFSLDEFKDFYYDKKQKKVYEVIRENSVQEITAIYNQETTGYSLRIQRFSKKTGAPQNQSFSFGGGDLKRFIKFIESIDLLDLSVKQNIKFTDEYIDETIERKKIINQIINSKNSLSTDEIFGLINNLQRSDKSDLLKKFIDNIDLYEFENLDAAIKQKEYKKSLLALEKIISLHEKDNFIEYINSDETLIDYKANQPEKVFQNWIEKNLWVFGVEYNKKHPFRKIGEDGSQADIILETADGFLSLIEIKRPISKSKLLRYDNSHRCYYPSSTLSEAIGQCLIYLQRIEDFKKTIENNHSVRILRPRVRLIIGRTNDLEPQEREFFHFINSSLHDIDIISYDQLIENAKKIISYYDN